MPRDLQLAIVLGWSSAVMHVFVVGHAGQEGATHTKSPKVTSPEGPLGLLAPASSELDEPFAQYGAPKPSGWQWHGGAKTVAPAR